MGSEQGWNKTNDETSFKPSEPALCANGCGFFGSAATMNLCSKCYRDLRIEEEQAASAKAAVEKSLNVGSLSKSVAMLNKAVLKAVESVAVETSSSVAVPSAVVSEESEPEIKVANRCGTCKKKVGLIGFKCRCGSTFCGTHRYAEKHDCTFDFKNSGRDAIAKANPVIKADKLEKI